MNRVCNSRVQVGASEVEGVARAGDGTGRARDVVGIAGCGKRESAIRLIALKLGSECS